MIKNIGLFLFLISVLSCRTKENDQVIFDRIRYIYHLKETLNDSIWQGFNDAKYDVPLIYYTDDASFVANPTAAFINRFAPKLVFENRLLKIYKTPERLDTITFHMATGIEFSDTSDFTYQSPFMKASSFEITHNTIPSVLNTEQWATMVLHEYFHGYQFKHAPFLNAAAPLFALPEDSLSAVYKNNAWFKQMVDKENEMLLKALQASDLKGTLAYVDSFFNIRKARRLQTKQQLHIDIQPYEILYETMEGSARYVEYRLYTQFAKLRPDYIVKESDKSFNDYQTFKNYTIEKDPWLYLSSKSATYYYATGFNMLRVLDKLNIDYKTKLFNDPNQSIENLLSLR